MEAIYYVLRSVDYEGDDVFFISHDKQEAIAKAEYHLNFATTEGRRHGSDEHYYVMEYKPAKTGRGEHHYFGESAQVYEAGAK